LIVGKLVCGKTALLLKLLLQPGWLDFSKLSVFGKSLFQAEYKILRKGFEEQLAKEMIMNIFENRDEILQEQISPNELIHELAKNQKTRSKELIECNFYESAVDVPDTKEISPEHKNLMIFDDLLLQKQNKWKSFKLGLLVFKSKLFQIASSKNSKKCKFLLSVSSRPEKYWSHF